MADFADVADVLVQTVAGTLYPNGTSQPSSVSFAVRCFQGWPLAEQIDADMKAGTGYVAIWPTPTERPTADHFPEWQQLSVSTLSLTAVVTSTSVAIGGAVATQQAIAIVADAKAYVYAVQAGDTLNTIATALAAGLTAAGAAATATGATVNVPGAKQLAARVGGSGVSIRELRRQERVFQLSCWAGTPASRDALGKAVDAALAAKWRIPLADGSMGLVAYRGSRQNDDSQKQLIYRRDLLYGVEYATTESRTDTQVLVDTLVLSGATVIASAVPSLTINS